MKNNISKLVKLRCSKKDCKFHKGLFVRKTQEDYYSDKKCPLCKSILVNITLVYNLTS